MVYGVLQMVPHTSIHEAKSTYLGESIELPIRASDNVCVELSDNSINPSRVFKY